MMLPLLAALAFSTLLPIPANAADPSPTPSPSTSAKTCTDFSGTWEGSCHLENQLPQPAAPLVLKQTDCNKLVLNSKGAENVYQIGGRPKSSLVIRNGITREVPDLVLWNDSAQDVLAIKRSAANPQDKKDEINGILKIVDSKLISESARGTSTERYICTYTKKVE